MVRYSSKLLAVALLTLPLLGCEIAITFPGDKGSSD
jgi:hypothetical protein